MERLLKPRIFETDHNDPKAAKQWKYFFKTFENFLTKVEHNEDDDEDANKLQLLVNHVSPDVFTYIEDCETYDAAIEVLKNIYVKPPNTVFARHLLATRRQQDGESLDSFLQALKDLSKDCNFTDVTADVYKNEYIRDSFITNIQSNHIRTRLLENNQLDLETMYAQARSLDSAQKSAVSFQSQFKVHSAATRDFQPKPKQRAGANSHTGQPPPSFNSSPPEHCPYCGFDFHPRPRCPARDATCNKCKRKGHWQRVCGFRIPSNQSGSAAAATSHSHQEDEAQCENQDYSATPMPWLASTLATTTPRSNICITPVVLEKYKSTYNALNDSGSDLNFIDAKIAAEHSLKIFPSNNTIAMADTTLSTKVMGYCTENLVVAGRFYPKVKFMVLPGLCCDIILGQTFQALHESVIVKYGGNQPSLVLGAANKVSDSVTPPSHISYLLAALGTLNIDPPALFPHLHPGITPIAAKSRKYSNTDRKFISEEIDRLLSEGIIEKSTSPWRAQCVVVSREGSTKKRLAIDYSETINKFTHLDAYPLPNLNDLVNTIATFKVFSTVDLRAAYHQCAIKEEDRPYTAFEANGGLFQFRRLPFGVTNGVAIFQREMDRFINENSLQGTYAYLDNITICGINKADHDLNLSRFIEAAKKANLTYNEDKCEFSTTRLKILGSVVENGTIKPDLDRLKPLLELSPPENIKQLRRTMGFFAHYSKYISNFSFKIRPLSQTTSFPLSTEAVAAFNSLKDDLKECVMGAIDINIPFVLETDASNHTLAGVLSQSGRPVAFFSRTLNASELKNPAVEKEAQAIIESVRHWRHFLTGVHFTIKTDQKSVRYVFDKDHRRKVKNIKMQRWRMELSCYEFDIEHRPGFHNIPADTFSRNTCASTVSNQLYLLHNSLCHPGVTRLNHYVKSKNLAFSLDEIREITKSCEICAKNKPKFSTQTHTLIKATQPFERLAVDFKGPLPSTNSNKYLLNVVCEYSRFPFSFPCSDMTTSTIIKCFTQLFSTYGTPCYIHTDQGSNFMSKELKSFLLERNVATSRTTPYNPMGNGQVEKTNGTIWKTITLALQSRNLPQECWQDVLPDALHSIRSLLCTATNSTPHERFFLFQRRSTNGPSVPSWLTDADSALLKVHVRNKQDPLVEEVSLLEVNPYYAHIRTGNGIEKTVSVRDLAQPGNIKPSTPMKESDPLPLQSSNIPMQEQSNIVDPPVPSETENNISESQTLMGNHGQHWCNVDERNIIEGKRRP